VGKGGLYSNVLRISPPLNITKGDADDAIRMMDAAFGEVDITD
jgi:4-aminobutyrate aminotransferase-like enzyme